MRRRALVVGVPVLLCMLAGACWASEKAEPQGEAARVSGAVWILPPAYEFPVSGGGHLSLEIGVTPGLWPEGIHSWEMLGPRVGVFVYPAGELEGLALYAGLGEFAEGGVWVVWRADRGDGPSERGRALSFRLGVGIASDGGGSGYPFPDIGLGASVGFGL